MLEKPPIYWNFSGKEERQNVKHFVEQLKADSQKVYVEFIFRTVKPKI